jgi:hypothetical protein
MGCEQRLQCEEWVCYRGNMGMSQSSKTATGVNQYQGLEMTLENNEIGKRKTACKLNTQGLIQGWAGDQDPNEHVRVRPLGASQVILMKVQHFPCTNE